jgi:UDP-2,3-diacylglucosamine hydrolase
MPEPPVYFFSDAHLGQEDAQNEALKVARLEALLERIRRRPGPVYVVGDLFDFWFEYRRAIPRGHIRTLAALAATRQAGCPMVYIGGNHDFWVGDFLEAEMGVRVEPEPVTLELQGRRLYLAHGDGLLARDSSYRAMKAIFRSPLNIRLYRMLHPDLGIPLALWVSRQSYRRHHTPRPLPLDEIHRDIVTPRFADGHDSVVLGHFHRPVHEAADGRDFLILGDWTSRFTFATLEDGRYRLWQWRDEGEPELIPPTAP